MSDEYSDLGDADGQAATKVDRDRRVPRFSWTPAYEATFFRSLCESVQLGLRENSSFKAEAWERAAQALEESHNACPTKSHLINKSDNARKRFRLWRGLREDPEFSYNPDTRTVTAAEDAWRRRIEREPLSRALRGRPFEHESYMEVLYPDVIGSGGAPKRIMKPKRRTDCLPGDENEVPGTSILNLKGGEKVSPKEPAGRSDEEETPVSATAQNTTTTAFPALPPRPASQSNVLTPPDEPSGAQGRKRNLSEAAPPLPTPIAVKSASDSPVAAPTPVVVGSPEKRARQSAPAEIARIASPATLNSSTLPTTPLLARTTSHDTSRRGPSEDFGSEHGAHRAVRQWREEAVDIFFRDFADESPEAQISISQSVLGDEHTAMVFCKMPNRVRERWVEMQRDASRRS